MSDRNTLARGDEVIGSEIDGVDRSACVATAISRWLTAWNGASLLRARSPPKWSATRGVAEAPAGLGHP
jgi:hypothetical protein